MTVAKHHINHEIHRRHLYMASFSSIGSVILSFAIVAFVYFFFWISVLPFMLIEEGNWGGHWVLLCLSERFVLWSKGRSCWSLYMHFFAQKYIFSCDDGSNITFRSVHHHRTYVLRWVCATIVPSASYDFDGCPWVDGFVIARFLPLTVHASTWLLCWR